MSTHGLIYGIVLVVVDVEVPEGGVGDGGQEDDPEQHPGVKVSERLGAPPPTDCRGTLSLRQQSETIYHLCRFGNRLCEMYIHY